MTSSRALIVLIVLMAVVTAHGADTVETFDLGMSNVELYGAFAGTGQDAPDQSVAGDVVLGMGITPGFSAYLGTTMQANGYLTGSETELAAGAFGTVLDSDHLDLDLMLDLRSVGGDGGRFTVSPGFELNLDHTPGLATRGLYLRGNVSIAGTQTDTGPQRATDLAFTLGGYVTLAETRQLLIEVDVAEVDEFGGGHAWEYGAVAIGYNAVINPALELISQVSVDIPQDDRDAALGFSLGFIATLPGSDGP
jgi:hypothetical protein